MGRLSRLAAVLATWLPAGAWLWPALIPAEISNGKRLLRREGSTHSRSPRPLSSAATGGVSWRAVDVTAARESLINSEGFRTLVERAEVRTSDLSGGGIKDSSTDDDDAGAGIIAMSAAASTQSRVTAPAIAAEAAAEAEVAGEEEKKVVSKSSWEKTSPWKRNAHKLESLRATVLDSEKAREMAASIRSASASASACTSTSTSSPDSHSPPTRHETTPPWAGDVASPTTSTDGNAQQAGKEGFISGEVGPRESERAYDVRGGRGGAGDEEGGGKRPVGIRWIRRVASKARGRVAAVVGRVGRRRGENVSG